jgi:cell division septal protein FtsQ
MRSSNLKYKKARREYGRLVVRVISFCILFLLIGIGTGLISHYKLFTVQTVEVLGTKSYVNKTDVKTMLSAAVLSKNMFFLEPSELESDIRDNFQGVKTVTIHRTITGKLRVSITEREPVALITTSRDTFGVDDDGYVLGILDPKTTNLPRLTYDGDVKVGLFIDKLIVPTYMDVLKSLDEEKIKVSSISVTDFDVRIFVDKGIEVLIARKSYSSKFAKQLKEVLNYMKTSGKSARRIDLRYDKVILSQN